MRSRYAAYAMGLVRYIMETTHPDNPQYQADFASWSKQLKGYCDRTQFLGLTVMEEALDVGGQRGWVRFGANLEQRGADMSFVESSIFVRSEDGRWLYLDGELRTPGEIDQVE